jgi:hypothetical protein
MYQVFQRSCNIFESLRAPFSLYLRSIDRQFRGRLEREVIIALIPIH